MNRLATLSIAGGAIIGIGLAARGLSNGSKTAGAGSSIANAEQAAIMIEAIRASTTYIPVHALPEPHASAGDYSPVRQPYHQTLLQAFTPASHTPPRKSLPGERFGLGTVTYTVVGHSGGSPVGGANSLAACIDARNHGAGWLELDVLITSDGVPFCYHDWGLLGENLGFDATATGAELEAAGVTTLPAALDGLSHLILDLVHNTPGDITRIVDYLNTSFPDRIRDDIVLQVWKRQDIEKIRAVDPSIRISFNLAAWSTLVAYGEVWPDSLSDIFATTDFYVINPSKTASDKLVRFLDRNGLENTFIAVMHDHDPQEIARLSKLGAIPMLHDVRRSTPFRLATGD